jgi:hypothetical protein
MKTCPRCKESKPISAFTNDGAAPYCRPCVSAYEKARHAANPIRRAALRFSLTDDEYKALLSRAAGKCDLCGKLVEQKRALHIDHDHKCCPAKAKSCGKCIRGVLCSTCNTGLGCFKDDPELLEKAIDYLTVRRK